MVLKMLESGESHPAGCACDEVAGGSMLAVDEAIQRAWNLAEPVKETELVGLQHVHGRVLARTVHASAAMPFFDNSAMDGFAVRLADFSADGSTVLPIDGETAAGGSGAADLEPGTCRRIFTGAAVPGGTDAVVPLEQVRAHSGSVEFHSIPAKGSNIRRAGGDIPRNAVLVSSGTRLNVRHAGLLAANGYSAVNVVRRPRVGVFSTGDELLEPGSLRQPGKLFDCNRPMLLMALEAAGCETVDLGSIEDSADATRRFLIEQSDRFDLLVSSGSVSVGARDFLKSAFLSAGGTIDNWRVAVKPGKPVMTGRIGRTVFLGLPGNPYAAWIGMHLVGRPITGRLSGGRCPQRTTLKAVAGNLIAHKRGREEYVPVRAEFSGSQIVLHRIGNGGSASLYAACQGDGIAIIAADGGDVDAGAAIDFLPFEEGAFQ